MYRPMYYTLFPLKVSRGSSGKPALSSLTSSLLKVSSFSVVTDCSLFKTSDYHHLVPVILQLRVYALYRRDRHILLLLLASFVACSTASLVVLSLNLVKLTGK